MNEIPESPTEKELREFDEALRELIDTILKELRIKDLVDWLESVLEKFI